MQWFALLTEFDKKVMKEATIQVLAHLVQDEPIADGTSFDVFPDFVQVFTFPEVSERGAAVYSRDRIFFLV